MELPHSRPRMTPIVSILLLQLCQCLLLSQSTTTPNRTLPRIPTVIVFGDSIMDPGNNNLVKTVVKCNFPPYGQDFVGHIPTGRFCNGKIPTDFIVSTLRIKEYMPAYLGTTLSPEDLLTGVSFASGGSGYDPLTPKIVSVISMSEQIEMYKEYKEKLRAIAGEVGAGSIISQSLFVVCAGSDDLANTYFTAPFRRAHYDVPSYVNLLVRSASGFIQELYSLGARKIGVLGIPPIGCVPAQRTLGGGILRDCSSVQNEAAQLFNTELAKEMRRLTKKLRGTQLIFVDIYASLLDIIQRPLHYGFYVSTKGCCGTGDLEVAVLCNGVTSTTCADVSKYVFWDSYHPTQRAYEILIEYVAEKYLPLLH